ncbi:hypothetical protein RKG19_25070 [Klebsiella pneumoniae]|nr:hypothetical protein [Klebsiella pneumoniae]MDY2286214.1 hypothetical protein [Klebsiella pneumoniae]MDY2308519.1 hypothetical protein [Klebsiella pneumoniae]MDY2330554.1 hypothetical protein [Klebsiella pneumoniae]MDY2347016.1 hypothetical protein [Klebsiella pneumoniae]
MMSLWDALRMNMMISYQELVRTFPNDETGHLILLCLTLFFIPINAGKALTCAKIWRRAEASILSHCFFNWGRRYARQQQKTGHIL